MFFVSRINLKFIIKNRSRRLLRKATESKVAKLNEGWDSTIWSRQTNDGHYSNKWVLLFFCFDLLFPLLQFTQKYCNTNYILKILIFVLSHTFLLLSHRPCLLSDYNFKEQTKPIRLLRARLIVNKWIANNVDNYCH